MKKITILFYLFCLSTGSLLAQTPQGFQYQAVARDGSGQPLADQNVDLRFSLVQSSVDGPVVYAEEHSAVTNAYGLFSLVVGAGFPATGAFEAVDWSEGPLFLRVELDVFGDGDYQLLGAQQLWSVPYALYAQSTAEPEDADADPENELQYLNLQGNQLSIGPSGSTTVSIPTVGGGSLWSLSGSDIFYEAGDVFVDRTLLVGDDVLLQNLSDPDALTGIELVTYEDGEGRALTFGANGSTNAALLSTDNFNDGGLSLYDQNSTERWAGGITGDNAGALELFGPNGNSNLALASAASNTNHGWLGLQDFDGFTQVLMTILDDTGEGYLETVGPNGQPNVQLSSVVGNANHGYVAVGESGGFEAASMAVLSNGEGVVATVGANGFDNVQLSSLAGYPNHGFVAVQDNQGDIRAGAYVDDFGDGILFADLKHFRTPHPEKADREIWYASLEGPEAAAYVRGTAKLEGGAAFVPFPEHFRLIANPATMTVMLTPLSADTRGLAVVEKTENGFRVKELMGGEGAFAFDWEVKCVRAGYEDYSVIREKSALKTAGRSRRKLESHRNDHSSLPPRNGERKAERR